MFILLSLKNTENKVFKWRPRGHMEEMADEGISSLRFLLIAMFPHWFT